MTYPYDDETEDRVIARALDADDSDEAAMDRATLDEYRQVLAYLPFEEIEPPAALEDRTIEAALARRPAEIPSINRRAKRRATARWVTLGAAVTAAAAVIGFMFVDRQRRQVDAGRSRRPRRRRHRRRRRPGARRRPESARRRSSATVTSSARPH